MSKRSAPKPSRPAPGVGSSSGETANKLQAALGKDYELGEALGSGGFADVYVAWDRRLKREVAVKTIRPELHGAAGIVERFRREAEAIAQVRHPHIIPIYSVGEGEGIAYFTMPRIRGESLAAAIQRDERWSFAEVTRILREAAGALAEAHRNGIVHRDVKPENIMLDGPERRVVVMDFGIAKSMDATVGGGLTGTGILIGTPHYMSPEQASGDRNIDHLSDQYSLGIVGYRMLTGRLPFDASSMQALLFQQAAITVTPVRELRPDIPLPLARVIERALQKDPAQRYPSMDRFAEALAGLATEVAGEFRTARRAPSMTDRWANVRLEVGGRAMRYMTLAVVSLGVFLATFLTSELALVRQAIGMRDEAFFAARTYLGTRGAPRSLSYTRRIVTNSPLTPFLPAAPSSDSLATRPLPVAYWSYQGNWPSEESWGAGIGLD